MKNGTLHWRLIHLHKSLNWDVNSEAAAPTERINTEASSQEKLQKHPSVGAFWIVPLTWDLLSFYWASDCFYFIFTDCFQIYFFSHDHQSLNTLAGGLVTMIDTPLTDAGHNSAAVFLETLIWRTDRLPLHTHCECVFCTVLKRHTQPCLHMWVTGLLPDWLTAWRTVHANQS